MDNISHTPAECNLGGERDVIEPHDNQPNADQDSREPPRTFTVVADDQAATVGIADLGPDSPLRYRLPLGCNRLVAQVENVFDWPSCAFINLIYGLQARQPRGLLQIDGSEPVANPFDVLLESLPDPAETERHARGRLILYSIAATFHKDAPDVAAEQIVARFRTMGITHVQTRSVLKLINERINGFRKIAEQSANNAHAKAKQFLEYMRDKTGITRHHRDVTFGMPHEERFAYNQVHSALIYINGVAYLGDEFYIYGDGVWNRMPDKEMVARVTEYLQIGNGICDNPDVTGRLVADVMANIKGLTYLPFWAEEVPFLLGKTPAGDWTMSRPSMLSFRNGLVDLALVIDTRPGMRGQQRLPVRSG